MQHKFYGYTTTGHVVAIKEIMLTSRDGSGLDGIPARRRAQFARCIRPCARWIKSRFWHCPRCCRHRVMGAWICHRDRDRLICKRRVVIYCFSRNNGGETHCVPIQLHYKLKNPPRHKPFTVREPVSCLCFLRCPLMLIFRAVYGNGPAILPTLASAFSSES